MQIWIFVTIMITMVILQWSWLTGIGPGRPAVPWRRGAAHWTGCHHHHRDNHHYNQVTNQRYAIPCIVKRMLIGDQGNCNSGRCKPKFTFVSTSAASNICGQGFSQRTLPAACIFNLINHSVNNSNLGEPLYGCVCAYQH